MGNNVATKTAGYPYVVEMNDEIPSLSDIERYSAEARLKNEEIASFRFAKAVAQLGIVISVLMCLMAAIGIVLATSISDDTQQLNSIYILAIAFIVLSAFVAFGVKSDARIAAIGAIDSKELKLIDSHPESCEKLTQWINEYDTIKVYVGKITTKNRLPTFAEFHCIERWVTQKQNNKPVDNLREILNIGA